MSPLTRAAPLGTGILVDGRFCEEMLVVRFEALDETGEDVSKQGCFSHGLPSSSKKTESPYPYVW
jgi:hypothetical protein